MIALTAAYLLSFAVFLLIAWASPARGWRLFWALLALGVGVGSINLQIEAVAFGVIGLAPAASALAMHAAIVAIMAAIAALAGRYMAVKNAPTMRFGAFRLAGVILSYEALYIVAGMIVFPYVAKFYADHQLPPFGHVIALQAVRACIFVASVSLLLRAGLRYAPLVLGVAFSVIGGLAPLLPDNPFMPAEMRALHAIEVGVSNFLFGAATGWLLTGKRAPAPAPATTQAAE